MANRSYGGVAKRSQASSGGRGKSGGLFGIMRDEWVFIKILLPYMAQLLGMVLVLILAAGVRLFIWVDHKWIARNHEQLALDTWVVTGIVVFSAFLLTWLAWTFWGQRKAIIIKEQAAVTVAVSHVWWLMALWEDYGTAIFSRWSLVSWFFGCIIIGLSWNLRRWSKGDGDEEVAADRGGLFSDLGLGEKTYVKDRQTIEGDVTTATLQLGPGYTVDDAKKSRHKLAGAMGLPTTQVHVRDMPDGRADQAQVVTLRKNPFADVKSLKWSGPDKQGENIIEPISYATYEDMTRGEVAVAGAAGGSHDHVLVMGMSGCGKSKCWQCIYGSVLNRREVNVIYIDPAKGLQTAGPLVSGLDWFVDTEAAGIAALNDIHRVIRIRTDYLTSRGLDQWEPGCGINFLFVHIEEAARFANVKQLIELVEAARSAGIKLIFSLQRASGKRISPDTRYNLGSSMCFGTYGLRDAEFALSEYTRTSGAVPHYWQNRFPGRHYLEASGVEPRMFPISLQVDWIDIAMLKEAVAAGDEFRTPMDSVTGEALGAGYAAYRRDVENGDTKWQQLQRNGLIVPDTIEIEPQAPSGTAEMSITKAEAERLLFEWLTMKSDNGVKEMQFKDIAAEVENVIDRKGPWINGVMKKWVASGHLPPQPRTGWYAMPVPKPKS